MSAIEDIQRLREEGRSDEEIQMYLQQQGISPQEIQTALSQSVIRDAVMSDSDQMQPSIGYPAQQEQYQPSTEAQGYAQQDYTQQYSQQGYTQNPTDIISEISEQIISEKFSLLKRDLDKIIDFKTTSEARIESINERLGRIEKIIDRLQLSILQKVGEYLINSNDLKKELLETQKSVSALTKSRHA